MRYDQGANLKDVHIGEMCKVITAVVKRECMSHSDEHALI